MPALPYRRLAGFYFFYFAYLGAFAPFFTLYLDAVGMSAVEIGVLMSLPQLTRIVAPHLWGWLADRGASGLRIARLAGVAGTVAWLGVYASTNFVWLFGVLLAVMPALAWSRLALKRHSPAEVAVGLLVGVAFGYAITNL